MGTVNFLGLRSKVVQISGLMSQFPLFQIKIRPNLVFNDEMCPNFGFFRSKFVQISGLITKFVQISAFSVQNSSNFLFNDEFCPNFGSFSSKFIKISVLKSRNVTFRVTQPPSHSLLFVLFKIIIQIPFRKLRPKTMRSTMATRCAWLYWSR